MQLIKNTILTLASLAALGVVRLVYNMVVGKSFGAAVLGDMNLVLSSAIFFSLIATSGFGPAAAKFVSEALGRSDGELAKKVYTFTLCMVVAVAFSLILVILLGWVIFDAGSVKDENMRYLLVLIPLYAVYVLNKRAYYGFDHVRKYLKAELIADTFFFISLAAVIFTRSYLILPFIVMYIAYFIISMLDLRRYLTTPRMVRPAASFAVISLIGTFASSSRYHLSIILNGFFLSKEFIGYYAAAFSALSILYFVPKAVSFVIFPSFSYRFGSEKMDEVQDLLAVSSRLLLIFSTFLCGAVILLGTELLPILFNAEFSQAKLAFQVLVIGIFFEIIAMPSVNSLSATRYVKIPNVAGVVGFLVSIGSWWFLIPNYGIEGTAVGYLAGSLTSAMISIVYSRKLLEAKVFGIGRGIIGGKSGEKGRTLSVFLAVVLFALSVIVGVVGGGSILARVLFFIVFTFIFLTVFRSDLLGFIRNGRKAIRSR